MRDFFRGVFTPDVLVVYRHSRNKSTEKGEAASDVSGLSLQMLSAGDSDGGRGWWAKCATRSTVQEGMVVKNRRQVVATGSYTPRNPCPIVPESFRGEGRGGYGRSVVESRERPRPREIRRDEKKDRADYILHGWENEFDDVHCKTEKGGTGGIGLCLGVRTLSGRYDPLYRILWSSTYPCVS